MNFTAMIKENLKDKYSSMLEGKTAPENQDIEVQNSDAFMSNYQSLVEQLKQDVKDVNNKIAKINTIKDTREADEQTEVAYKEAVSLYKAEAYAKAKNAFNKIKGYKDSAAWIGKCQEQIDRQEKKEAFDALLGVTSYVLPAIWAIASIIVAFVNRQQITITSNFFLWLVLSLVIPAAVIGICAFLVKALNGKVAMLASVVLAIGLTVLMIANPAKLSSDFGPSSLVKFEVTDKTEYTRGSYKCSKISFQLETVSDVKVTGIYGEMKMYNGDVEVGTWEVTFEDEYEGNNTYNVYVEFEEYNRSELYDTSLTGLALSYHITSMTFEDEDKEYEFKNDAVWVKTSGVGTDAESKYQTALSLYNEGKYTEAKSIFNTLEGYKDASEYISKCETQLWLEKMMNELYEVAGSGAIVPDKPALSGAGGYSVNSEYYYNSTYYTTFLTSFEVPEAEINTYVSAFKTKLEANGFQEIDVNTYRKGITIIQFSDVNEGWNDYYITYRAWKID